MKIGFFEINVSVKRANEKDGVLYLAYDKYFKRYKVGITTKKAAERIKQIENASGTELILINTFEGSRKNEKKLHEYLEAYKLKGEWYKDDKKVEELFERFEIGVLTGF